MDEGGQVQRDRDRRRRSIVIALVLGGLVILFFLMTIVKLTARFGA